MEFYKPFDDSIQALLMNYKKICKYMYKICEFEQFEPHD